MRRHQDKSLCIFLCYGGINMIVSILVCVELFSAKLYERNSRWGYCWRRNNVSLCWEFKAIVYSLCKARPSGSEYSLVCLAYCQKCLHVCVREREWRWRARLLVCARGRICIHIHVRELSHHTYLKRQQNIMPPSSTPPRPPQFAQTNQCTHLSISFFLVFERFLAPCFFELLMFYC